MLLATHGRAIWILDNLSPIQEYAAAQSSTADAKLFTPPPRRCSGGPRAIATTSSGGTRRSSARTRRKPRCSPGCIKKPADEVALKITDATGREVREISGPVLANSTRRESSRRAGICGCSPRRRRQLRRRTRSRRRGWRASGRWRRTGGSGRRAGRTESAEPVRRRLRRRQAGGGGGGFGGGGAANAGPYVLPGVYTVALIVDGKSMDTKPLRVNADPEVVLTEVERKKLYDMAMETARSAQTRDRGREPDRAVQYPRYRTRERRRRQERDSWLTSRRRSTR